jgi:hypothetical protein
MTMSESTLNNGHRGGKRLLAVLLATAAIAYAGCAPAGYSTARYDEPQLSDYEFLSSYGEWVSVPHYGLVWRPYVVADWAPYYYGHWIWTDDGWAWVSYEPFGMLVYHYGYWDYSLRYGWVWIPDDVWSPARVEWYTFDDYCAWAPMPPPRMRWHDPWDNWDVDPWIVVPIDRFTDDDVGKYRVREKTRSEIVGRGTAVKDPPAILRIERATKAPVRQIRMERERMPIDLDIMKTPPKPGRPGKSPLRKMVLPAQEREKVNEHAPKVEREVLTPKKVQPERKSVQDDTRDTQREKEKTQQEKKEQEKKKDKGRR